MKISDIKASTKAELDDKATFVLSSEAKKSLDLIACTKGKTISGLVREIVDDFLKKNSDELKDLVG